MNPFANWQRRLWLISIILCIALGIGLIHLSPAPSQTGQAQEDENPPLVRLNEDNLKQATVFIMQAVETPTGPAITCVGAGTLVRADGLILTNAHIVEPSATCPADRIIIALTLRIDEPPVATYTAEIAELNRGYDLAVLRINRYLDGRNIEPSTLQLPFVELGNSDAVAIDDTITVFGYPEIANDPISVIRGTIGGFTAEAGLGDRAWLRTTAQIPGLMSGGGAYNRDGELVGVPTIAPARAGGEVLECRQVYDTNGDGQLDNEDLCIPIGTTISAIRPSNLARGLVRAAALGIQTGPERNPLELPLPTESATFRRLFISTSINTAGMPTNVVTSLPTGTNSLYLFFDYENMQNGQVYELRTTVQSIPSVLYSLPPVTWNGGERGLWHIGGNVPTGWEPGTYVFTLYIEGQQNASHSITIGGGPNSNPQFSDLVFGIQSPQGDFTGANYVIPEGPIIRARFNYQNMRDGLQWRQRWYKNGDLLEFTDGSSGIGIWGSGSNGTTSNPSISNPAGFGSAQYRLEVYVELPTGETWCLPRPDIAPDLTNWCLMVTSDFVIAGGAGGANNAQALIFDGFQFARNQQGTEPVGLIGESVTTGQPSIYVFFNWRQVAPGTPFTWRWLVDDEILVENRTQWPTTDVNGTNYYFSLVGRPILPDATYRFELFMGGIRLTDETVEVEVGSGQLNIEAFASAEGVQLTGQVLDAATGQGVSGALFVVLLAEFSVEDFLWQTAQVLGRAQADEEGFFQIPALLPRGTLEEPALYSVVIRAEGYLPVNADGISVTTETESPVNLVVRLNRDLASYGAIE